MRRRTFLQLSGAAALTGYGARSWAADAPKASDLAGDIDILKQALALHPGLHRYNTPAAMDARIAALRQAFAASGSRDERYLLLSRFLAAIRCGHSYANFFNQKKAVTAELFDRPTRLPFHFVWIGEKMIVLRDRTGLIAPGSEITAINGTPPRGLRNRLFPYVRADGHNDAKRLSLLEVRGDDDIETFDVFQGLLAPPSGSAHRVTLRERSGRVRSLELPALNLAQRRAQMAGLPDKAADQPIWDWTVRPDSVAVLTMDGWALYNSKWDWKNWLNERLDSLSGTRGLIVDLRNNEGGNDCGDPILARLIDRPFAPPAIQQRLRFRRTPAALDRYLDTWDDSFRTMGVEAKDLGGGFLLRPGKEDPLTIEPAEKRLGVPVVVLTSPVNSSATFQFANNLRAIGRGKLVGRTTGGNRRGINGGAFFFVRLPASELEFDLPLVGYFPLTPQPDAGLVPDVLIAPTAADIASGRDRTMEQASALLTAKA